ncbi:MAG TPA: MarR family transcriptional regulator [Candidatus Limnocylindria bacterium]|nr:MarR family transcriptional regulator [Candidatus Limnocylindria bacterium]
MEHTRYHISVIPNYPEFPNILPRPNEEPIARVIAAYDRFHARITRLHAPHVVELNLTLAQLKALYLIASSGPMRMSELAERLGTAASTASGVVDALVQLQLVERIEDPADRRQVLVNATAGARERLDDFSELGHRRIRELLEQIQAPSDLVTIERAIDLLSGAAGHIERNLS